MCQPIQRVGPLVSLKLSHLQISGPHHRSCPKTDAKNEHVISCSNLQRVQSSRGICHVSLLPLC